MAEGKKNSHGCRLVVSGVVVSVRDWTTKDTPPQAKRTIDVAWFGGHQEFTVDAGDPAFAKIGEGQEIAVSVAFAEHPRFGWKAKGSYELVKVGA